MSQDHMTCAEAEPLLPLVADGAVDPATDPQLFAHLAGCDACQRIVAEHDLVTLALQRGALDRAAARPRNPVIRWQRLAAAAVIVLAIGATAWLLRDGRQPAHAAEVAAAPPAQPRTAATAPAIAAQAVPAEPQEVLRLPQADGSSIYLVRRGDRWMAIDPAQLDGPGEPVRSNADGHQVLQRYPY